MMNDVTQPLAPAGRRLMVPPDCVMICRQSASPMPEPFFLVLKKGMKMSWRIWSGMGLPLFEMRMRSGDAPYW